ncbi:MULTISPECIES: F0F1 ATP synthase subunit delta [Microbacterium]|uniref:F0F1 ATP synthase subunit delta n=1 Tax=Microbacterium TaxID=33882 RepID=UPI001E46109A|nr:F0F1 ATP synthase subunit delta [Microbacterium nymphoidis]MCD2499849.1 F0F1 ATP synthase subunit delta [Microbacterium nymphoidis]
MGSATTQALAASVKALDAHTLDLATARDLFAAARAVSESTQLAGALSDSAAPVAAREQVVKAVFGSALGAVAVDVLTTVAAQRWSDAAGLADGIEELAIRAASAADANADIEGELFGFSRTIAQNPDLELALGSRLGQSAAKGALVEKLIGAAASPATTLIVSSLVQLPRERRVRQLLNRAMDIVSAQRGRTVATVVSASPLNDEQSKRLTAALAAKYGSGVTLNTVIDPTVVGGLRVQIADDVIDGSISSRLADVRHKLIG